MKKKSKILLKYILIFVLVLNIFTNININKNHIYAQSTSPEELVNDIKGNYDGNKGLIPDCGRTDKDSRTDTVCTPKDAVKLGIDLLQLAIYVIITALVMTLIIAGVGYVYYGKNPQYIIKIKKYFWNSTIALGVIVLIFSIFAFLDAIGFNPELSNFFKQLFAFDNFSLINHAYAQEVPALTTGTNRYVSFFSWTDIFTPILLALKFIINYFAAPALVIATVIAGFMFVNAQGNPQKLDEAKKFATRVVVGIVIATTAQLITSVLLNTIKDVASQAGINTTQQADVNEGGD